MQGKEEITRSTLNPTTLLRFKTLRPKDEGHEIRQSILHALRITKALAFGLVLANLMVFS